MIFSKWSGIIIIGIAVAADLYAYIRRDDFTGQNLTDLVPGLVIFAAFILLLPIGIIGWIVSGSAIYMIFPAIGLVMLIVGIIIIVFLSWGWH